MAKLCRKVFGTIGDTLKVTPSREASCKARFSHRATVSGETGTADLSLSRLRPGQSKSVLRMPKVAISDCIRAR